MVFDNDRQTFTNPRPNLLKLLAQCGPVPGNDVAAAPEENGVGKRDKRKNDGEERAKKKSRSEKVVSISLIDPKRMVADCWAIVRHGETCRWLTEVGRR
jgi:hypothetical protein